MEFNVANITQIISDKDQVVSDRVTIIQDYVSASIIGIAPPQTPSIPFGVFITHCVLSRIRLLRRGFVKIVTMKARSHQQRLIRTELSYNNVSGP